MEISDEQLNRIDSNLSKLASVKHNFLVAIVRGIGTTLGATVVTATIIGIITWVIDSLGGLPFIESILDQVK